MIITDSGLLERETQLVPSDDGACIFTDDIILEILSRVPGKSLLRFRRVCKSWCTLISGPNFVRKQLCQAVRHNTNWRLLMFTSWRHLNSIDYESLLSLLAKNKHENISRIVVSRCRKHKLPIMQPERRFVQIMGSSNGLICLYINCENVFLWNPCTGNSNEIPKPAPKVFLPSFYGFGYDSATDDYKVICQCLTEHLTYEVFLYTLKMGSWRILEGLNDRELRRRGLLFNGALHWIDYKHGEDGKIRAKSAIGRVGAKSVITSFDLAREKFQELVPLPSVLEDQSIGYDVGDYKCSNLLCLLTNFSLWNTEIWVMMEYGVEESWTKLILLEDQNLSHTVYVSQDDKIFIQSTQGGLKLYDIKENRYRSALKPKKSLSLDLAMYVETLISPVTGK
ncbi:F-box/kelch-repeat protein At3g06240-like [Pyrus communis]|uniref:F-box/kelch-repeat protein At3g06240-like n=1 Tax=Pyrus communis TaxID=23211 RepID=UPI0035BED178